MTSIVNTTTLIYHLSKQSTSAEMSSHHSPRRIAECGTQIATLLHEKTYEVADGNEKIVHTSIIRTGSVYHYVFRSGHAGRSICRSSRHSR